MHETLQSRAAVSGVGAPRGVRLVEIQALGKVDLRGDPADRAFMSAVGRALDLVLPTEPLSSTVQGDVAALWQGPDQWLIVCPRDRVAGVIGRLREAIDGAHASVVDVSAGRVAFRLSGPNARDVLAKGCPLDLHPRAAKPGYVAGSVLAKITALIHLRDEDAVDLHVGRSFADYLWAWLEEAGLEYGVTTG
jgi:sarcosine oxidase subunit gamma